MKNSCNFLMILFFMVAFSSCRSHKKGEEFKGENEQKTLRFAMENPPQTFFLREVNDYYSALLLNQIAEGLVKLDPKTLNVIPALASSWDVSNDGLTYTFHLRKNVVFHNHKAFKNKKANLFTSEDVLFTYELAAKKNAEGLGSHAYNSFLKSTVVGAEAFHNGEATIISGIKAIDDYTVSIKLIHPDLNFVNKLASIYLGIVAKEVVENGNETDLIGTGPFMYVEEVASPTPHIILAKNPNYYLKDKSGHQLPYLDTLFIYIENNQLKQLKMFEEEKLDFIQNIPPSKITKILQERMADFSGKPPLMKLSNDPLMMTQYYNLNLNSPALRDVRVRKALNYAFNRGKLISRVLKNRFSAATYGIVPPLKRAFSGYDFDLVKKNSYSYNPEKARNLLAEAGYPKGKGFPSLTLKFNLGTIHSAVADEFRKQMKKELNINVNIEGLSFESKTHDAQTGNGDIFRTSWFADYKSPETFLNNFYGKLVPADKSGVSKINVTRYNNKKFDALLDKARMEKNAEKSNQLFSEAESIMMKDAPIIPLWYGEQYIIQYFKVRNLETNPIMYMDFTHVRIQDWTKEEYKKASQKEK